MWRKKVSPLFCVRFKIRDRRGSEAPARSETSRWNIYAWGNKTGQFTLSNKAYNNSVTFCKHSHYLKLISGEMFFFRFEPAGLSSDTGTNDKVVEHHPGSDGWEARSLYSWAHSERGEILIVKQVYKLSCFSVKMLTFWCQKTIHVDSHKADIVFERLKTLNTNISFFCNYFFYF